MIEPEPVYTAYRVELLAVVEEHELDRYCDGARTTLPRDPLEWKAPDLLRACAFSLVLTDKSRVLAVERIVTP